MVNTIIPAPIKMELEDPIYMNELLEKPIMFRIDNENAINRIDDEIIDDGTDADEIPEAQKTPWQYSFDELKQQMTKIPNISHSIYKRIINAGRGDVIGDRKVRIQWTYSMFMEKEADSFDSSFMGGSNVRTSSWDEILEGFWLALKTMRIDEESQFVIDCKLLYGKFGHVTGVYKIKPNADVMLVAKLVDFREIGSEHACDNLTDEELRQFAVVKVKALEMFHQVKDLQRKNSYAHAIDVGSKIMDRLRFCAIENGEEEKEKRKFIADIYVVLIDCYVKVEKYKKVVSMVNELRGFIDIDSNVNVLVNEAIAYSKIGDDFNRAIGLLCKAQQIDPHSKLVNDTLADVQKARQKYKDDTKEFMRKAFQMKPQNKPAAKDTDAKDKSKLAEVIKSFDAIDIGSGIPLVGYTPNELKEIEDELKSKSGYKLQVGTKNNGETSYTIRKST